MTKRGMNASDLVAQLSRDPEYLRRQAQHQAAIEERTKTGIRAEAPILSDLAAAGYRLETVWDLVNTRANYGSAVPILFEHLSRDYPPDVSIGIARALAVSEARSYKREILKLYERASEPAPNGMKTALACAVAAVADDEIELDIIRLVGDPTHGSSRMMLLNVLVNSSTPAARQALTEAAKDPELQKEAKFLLRKRRRR